MEEALRALLLAYAPLTALVGQRIYWGDLPQGAADPNVRMNVVSGGPTYHLQGPTDLEAKRVQIDVRGVVAPPWAVSRAIKDRLSGFKGEQSGIAFEGIFLDSERQGSETPKNTTYFTVSMDFIVWAGPA